MPLFYYVWMIPILLYYNNAINLPLGQYLCYRASTPPEIVV